MPIELTTLLGVNPPGGAVTKAATAGAAGGGFAAQLETLIDGVEGASQEANNAVTGMLDKSLDVHDAMIALQRAEMSLQLTMQIRNKLVAAYQEVMRMPV